MRLLAILLLSAAPLLAAELKVATLHPLLGDLVRQVGGDRVELIELVARGDDPHHFEPTPEQLRQAAGTDLCLASGKGLESYLPSLRSVLPATTRLVEVGKTLPSLSGSCNHPDHHHAHETDPHWWHSIDLFRRATGIVAESLAEADPTQAEAYRARALAYRRELGELESWTKRRIARIPHDRRVLATAHAAFGYFCHDFGFTALPVQGLNREQMPDARSLADLIKQIRESGVPAVFPEDSSNPKTLEALARDLGIRIAPPLIADGSTAEDYQGMMRHNVTIIVEALAAPARP
jgi:zinc/manganese transport system substrate-binding protein